jgi:biotin carboxyl carrier protein
MKEIELKERELDHKIDIDNKKLQVSAANQAGNLVIQQERVESENDRAAANTMAKIATDSARENIKAQLDGTRLAVEAARVLQERQVRSGGGGE